MKFLDNLAIRMVVFILLFIVLFLAVSYLLDTFLLHQQFHINPGTFVLPIILGVVEAIQYGKQKNK